MRNPYIVGRWLRGPEHYGRHRLIEYLLSAPDPAMWVVGTRRMGKTSLLRQLEWLCEEEDHELVPLFWDLQACETAEDVDYELFLAVEDESERFECYGVNVGELHGQDAVRILRTLQRALREHDKRLFLLIDEAEALINLARNDDRALARLRKEFQRGAQRTIMTATKMLTQLDDLTRHWVTSPFLFGFSLVNLWSLDPQSSRSLILQEQSQYTMQVELECIEEVLTHTYRHPYLIQYLCYHLFESTSTDQGTLRPIRDEDLHPDHLLSGFLRIDFDHLSSTERQILLTVAKHGVISEDALIAQVDAESPHLIAMFVYGMNKLGYLRQIFGQWMVGNEFLRRWILGHYEALSQEVHSAISDNCVETLLLAGREMELSYLRHEIPLLQKRLDTLLAIRAGYGDDVPLELSIEIQEVRQELNATSEQLHELTQATQEPVSESN